MPSIDTLAQAYARKRKPPRNFGVTGAIPGFGGYQQESIARKVGEARARHDDFPYSRIPFQRKRRGPTRPTPGSRPHRPQWN